MKSTQRELLGFATWCKSNRLILTAQENQGWALCCQQTNVPCSGHSTTYAKISPVAGEFKRLGVYCWDAQDAPNLILNFLKEREIDTVILPTKTIEVDFTKMEKLLNVTVQELEF